MAKAADIVGPITLTVLVKQRIWDIVCCSALGLSEKITEVITFFIQDGCNFFISICPGISGDQ